MVCQTDLALKCHLPRCDCLRAPCHYNDRTKRHVDFVYVRFTSIFTELAEGLNVETLPQYCRCTSFPVLTVHGPLTHLKWEKPSPSFQRRNTCRCETYLCQEIGEQFENYSLFKVQQKITHDWHRIIRQQSEFIILCVLMGKIARWRMYLSGAGTDM